MRLLRSLFYNMALGKFLDVQAAFGASGLHAKLVDASLDLLHGPSATAALVRLGPAGLLSRPAQSQDANPTFRSLKVTVPAGFSTCLQEELAAELCLLAPARLEHLIPPMPRMMHAVLRALRGSDASVAVALKVGLHCSSPGPFTRRCTKAIMGCAGQVLDLWVDSFNPEFIERSMAGVIRDLMLALWAHIQPHPNPHGTKVGKQVRGWDAHLLACATSCWLAPPCRWQRSWASWAADHGSGCLMAW